MESQRRHFGSVDIPDELSIAGIGAGIHQGRQQGLCDPAIDEGMMNIDRMLERVAIGWALAERYGVRVAGDGTIDLGDQMWQAAVAHILASPFQILILERLGLTAAEVAEPARDMMAIDGEHGRHVRVS